MIHLLPGDFDHKLIYRLRFSYFTLCQLFSKNLVSQNIQFFYEMPETDTGLELNALADLTADLKLNLAISEALATHPGRGVIDGTFAN